MLLEHEESYTVVDSDQLGFLQHDGFSWQVMGNHFVTLRQMTRQAHLSDLKLRSWVHGMSVEQRERFVDALFTVLTASGAVTLRDLQSDSFKAAGAMVKAMKDLDKETRDGPVGIYEAAFHEQFPYGPGGDPGGHGEEAGPEVGTKENAGGRSRRQVKERSTLHESHCLYIPDGIYETICRIAVGGHRCAGLVRQRGGQAGACPQ